MTTQAQHTEARTNTDAAREAFNTAKTRKARREADEALNYWMGKTAFLEAMLERGE